LPLEHSFGGGDTCHRVVDFALRRGRCQSVCCGRSIAGGWSSALT
jgi:hypothetical protein